MSLNLSVHSLSYTLHSPYFTVTSRSYRRPTGQPLQPHFAPIDAMETNSPEIILLACGILLLVLVMSLVLWLGHRERRDERRASQESQTSYSTRAEGRQCLFKEVFADHPDHDSPMIRLQDNDSGSPSFIANVRKRSQTIAGTVQHELRDIRHSLRNESSVKESQPLLDGLSDVGSLTESRTDTAGQDLSDKDTNDRHSSTAHRRTSSVVKTSRLKTRKSQDKPLIEYDRG